MLLHAGSELAAHAVVHESVEGRPGNDSHFSEDTMLPIWEQEVSVRVVLSPNRKLPRVRVRRLALQIRLRRDVLL